MNKYSEQQDAFPVLQKLTLIVNPHEATRFVHIAKEKGLCDVFVLQGKGTVRNHFLNFLGIRSRERTVVSAVLERERAQALLEEFSEALKLDEPNRGIAFTSSIQVACHVNEEKQSSCCSGQDAEGREMFRKLTVVVNLGMADEVMKIACRAGAKGGTVLHGREADATCKETLFGIEIEPEKEVILILAPKAVADTIIEDLSRELDPESAGNGILFVESVCDVRGLAVE